MVHNAPGGGTKAVAVVDALTSALPTGLVSAPFTTFVCSRTARVSEVPHGLLLVDHRQGRGMES